VRRGQGELVGVGEVKVVDADDQRRQALALLQRLGQGAHECRFPHALHPVQPYDKRPRIGLARVPGPVLGEARENKGDADWRLVVDYARLQGRIRGGHV
jgi:hypothetical protein